MNPPPKTVLLQRFLAIDIHKHYVMVGGQNRQQEWTLRPRRILMPRFRDWAAQHFRLGDAVVLETTGSVWDIYDIVAPLVSQIVVANAHKVRQIAEARVKTDKADIQRLLTLLIANIVPEVWVPPPHVRELRALISFRRRLNKQLTMSKNRLHSVVQRFNLQPPAGGLLADKNQAWWHQQELTDLTAFQVTCDREIIAQLETQKTAIDQQLAQLSNSEPWASQIVYLLQIPGFGLIFSMVVLSAIGDIARFAHPKQLVGYAGLGAGVHASGEKHQGKSITKEGRKELRWATVEAAWVAVGSDPYWQAQFQRLEKRMPRNKAIVAIARRLLVSIWHILTKREPYRHFETETIAYKMLTWAWSLDETARKGLTRAQFAKYGLLRLGIGQDLERIERGGYPRRLAPAAEVLALKPELRPPP